MGKSDDKPTVFISYAREDEAWKEKLLRHLKGLENAGQIRLWHDGMITTGDDWYPAIQAAMADAEVAVCLISADFLASDFIIKEEIPYLLERRRAEGMLLLPVAIWPVALKPIRWLRNIQIFPDPKEPLASIESEAKVEQKLADIAEFIFTWLSSQTPPSFRAKEVMRAPKISVAARGMLAAIEPPVSERAPLAEEFVDIDRLPKTGTDIFGRDEELDLLDEAWESEETHVLSFVAWGGVGKSALVNKWLHGLEQDNYRGAERVYAWSFYSQGTGERVTSADIFIDQALRWFGDAEFAGTNRSGWDKGQRLAELVQQQRTLLLLDGVEPLQSHYEHDKGQVKDPALRVLIEALGKKDPGLCVITTRESLTGLERFGERIKQEDLEQISAQAGRALLRVAGIRGTDAELEQTSRDFGNHALAINLLGAYLKDEPGRHINHACSIPDVGIPEEEGRHPRRLMEAFAKKFEGQPELNVLNMMGLFDRPASAKEIKALRTETAIPDLTDRIRLLSHGEWERTLHHLRSVRLLAPPSHHEPKGLDAHPLVREHFSQRLKGQNDEAWKQGHSHLFEFLCKSAPRLPETLEEMAPLFPAIAHGCQAGRYREALNDVYFRRIKRGRKGFDTWSLGAFGADLGALFGFLKKPWSRAVEALRRSDRAYTLNNVALDLRALGRPREAVEPAQAVLHATHDLNDWKNAALACDNLSDVLLICGEVSHALERAHEGVRFADRSGDAFARITSRVALGDRFHQAGHLAQAEAVLHEAQEIHKRMDPDDPILYSLGGFWCCDLVLNQGGFEDVCKRATQTLIVAGKNRWLIDTALDRVSLARAHVMAIQREHSSDFAEADDHICQAVDDLRRAGMQEHLSLGLLARAEYYRVRGQREGVGEFLKQGRRDLDEAWSVATRGEMRLYECDVHLECCRLLLVMVEGGVKLKADDIEIGSPFELYDAVGDPVGAARQHLEEAGVMVDEMGYHRRDPEILLETAHVQIHQGQKGAARETLAKAKAKIDEMGCHRWDYDHEKYSAML